MNINIASFLCFIARVDPPAFSFYPLALRAALFFPEGCVWHVVVRGARSVEGARLEFRSPPASKERFMARYPKRTVMRNRAALFAPS